MKRQVVIRELAEQDLREAQEWYEDKRPGLGAEFLSAIDHSLNRIRENPLAYPIVYR